MKHPHVFTLAVLCFALASCAAFWRAAPAALDTAACALRLRDLPWLEVVAKCGVTKDNEDAIRDLVGQEKARDAELRRESGCKW